MVGRRLRGVCYLRVHTTDRRPEGRHDDKSELGSERAEDGAVARDHRAREVGSRPVSHTARWPRWPARILDVGLSLSECGACATSLNPAPLSVAREAAMGLSVSPGKTDQRREPHVATRLPLSRPRLDPCGFETVRRRRTSETSGLISLTPRGGATIVGCCRAVARRVSRRSASSPWLQHVGNPKGDTHEAFSYRSCSGCRCASADRI